MPIELSSLDIMKTVDELSRIALTSRDKTEALARIVDLSKRILGSCLCTVTLVDLDQHVLHLAGCAGCETSSSESSENRIARLGSITIGDTIDYDLISLGEIIARYNLQQDGQGIASTEVVRKYGIHSALCYPLKKNGQLLGYLNHFSTRNTPFAETEEYWLATLAHQTTAVLVTFENLMSRKRLEELNSITQHISTLRDTDELLTYVLQKSMVLVGAEHGLVGRFDLSTGTLKVVSLSDNPPKQRPLQPGEGVVDQALRKKRPIRIGDIHSSIYRRHYVEFWPDTCSELVVPILVSDAEVRIGREKERKTKPIGVLNFESHREAAFTTEDEDLLWSLAQSTAVICDKLELDRKVAGLAGVQRDLLGKQDWHEILETLGRAITDTLGYEFVNISIVKPELKRIATEYISGIPEGEVEAFKRLADHSLESSDIQADLVLNPAIQVPGIEDERFDTKIYKRFGHDRLIRVFVPMVAQSDRHAQLDRYVVGTVEAGYGRGFREYIYEQDIEILKGFVDYVTRALERRERSFLNRISHELRAPIVGIRNNANYLQRKYHVMEPKRIQRKFDDIRVDCEIALLQVKEMEYVLGRVPPDDKIESTLVFRDIVIKTVRQLAPLAQAKGFDASRMTYDRGGIRKVGNLYIDRAKLGQVVYNILINSIKYAESDSGEFAIFVNADDTKGYHIIGFRDWGIGIRRGLEKRVFEEGYRAPEAIEKDVTGSGLGLTISRKIMEDMGGDLLLTLIHKPTEFQVWLPKSLKEAPK